MADVYRAQDPVLARTVALKILKPHLASDEESVRRFRRGAKAEARLSHPHIITIYEVDEDKGYHFIAMEFLPGETLKQVIDRRGKLPPAEVVHVLEQVAVALDYAHDNDMIHRDIKPANIMVRSDGYATLLDFGLVLVMGSPGITRVGTIMGTPEYMSPEQCDSKPITAATDIYSLGIVTYEMVAGRPPFMGEHYLSVMNKHTHEKPTSPRHHNPALPGAVEHAVLKAIAKQPDQRWPDALSFAAAVREGYDGSKGRTSRQRRTPTPTPELTQNIPPPPAPPFNMRAILAGLLLAGVLLAGAYFAVRSWPGEPINATTTPTGTGGGGIVESSPTPTAGEPAVVASSTTAPVVGTDTPHPSPTNTATPLPTPTPAATATPRNTPTPESSPTPTPEPVQVNFWGIHGPVLPADQLCTEMHWDTRGVTDVRFQAGDDDQDPDPVDPVGNRKNLCFHGEITFRLYYKLPSGEERRAEYVVKHADD